MEMANYILRVLRSQLMIMLSWGFHNPEALPNNEGLRFNVQGFKFKGTVEVIYNEGWDLFDVRFIKNGKVIDTIEELYLDGLVDAIDRYVEKTDDYQKRVKDEYSVIMF
jgi:hypothetical protein